KALGAQVTAVTSTGNLALVHSLGADRTIDYTKEDFTRGAQRYDVIIDCGGGHSLFAYRRALKPHGRFVWVGEVGMGRWIEPLSDLFVKPALMSHLGSRQFLSFVSTLSEANLETVRNLIEAGKVKPVIDRQYPLSRTADALGYLATGHARGKVVIDIARDIAIDGANVYPESVTATADGAVYVGSLGGTVYRAAPGAHSAEPWIGRSDTNGLLSIFGVLADEQSRSLWVCTAPAALPGGVAHGQAALVRFNLSTGAFLHRYPLSSPRSICDDVALDRDGTAFVADIGAGEILTLAPGAEALTVFARDAALEGIDGLAFAADGTLYVDNVRRNELLRVERAPNGRFGRLVKLRTSAPLGGPDGFRPVGGSRFVLAESRFGRIDEVTIRGDEAQIDVLRSGLDSPSGVAFAGGTVYAVEGRIEYLFDPKLRGRSPGPFIVQALRLP
ncbi:MAG TPA: zinc-binding dehydrogenase, partial [Gammaproteobacteria bacterium]|nr:zinc-binding dehydrogenase [Gammaproteobacteria bacterium]